MATAEYVPRFGEVWQWEDMGPFMILGMSPMAGQVNVIELKDEDGIGRLCSLVWDLPGRSFRAGWKRIDTEELGA